eukprot:Gregarina_sp_Poly_1__719@NODE_1170_length_4869_cov_152_708663_g801_i0_p2_GENE_NODE_1170_length_4869_cov_152_708663_g801_i0NODE_1170_length_4869_cov_152_708663_g801_i0_p2_ORF_typecomplete_len291_score16_08Pkinase/PF00069_25/0_0016RIO1/PF01163_22/0_031Pkinase_fungal/PF17667_1/0_045Kdo/PF06293_14/2_3e03Kdo/PF06293_14/0_1APH/PF01636_23/0_12Transpos_assoc/PF13963_6/4_8e03Transpos_assoc/PF13963_6/0_36WaaY/PF06176_11/1_3e03WaaY/PF06176_11/4_7WaaY/PF06176_11/3_6e02_NODE_1170_length_4869_cov_152_708663_g
MFDNEITRSRILTPKLVITQDGKNIRHASPHNYEIVNKQTQSSVPHIIMQDWVKGLTAHALLRTVRKKYEDSLMKLVRFTWSPADIRKWVTRVQRYFRDFFLILDLLLYTIPIVLWDNDVIHCDLHLKNIMIEEHYSDDQPSIWQLVRQGRAMLGINPMIKPPLIGPIYNFSPGNVKIIDLSSALNSKKCNTEELQRPCTKCKNNGQLEDASLFFKAVARSFLNETYRPLNILHNIDNAMRQAVVRIQNDLISRQDAYFMGMIHFLESLNVSPCLRKLDRR